MNFVKKILSAHSKESSKRFSAIWSLGLLAVTCVVVWVKGSATENLMLAGTIITFICTLLGLATRESLRKQSIEKESPKNVTEEF